MAESILVTGKRISSMELVSNVTGDEKIPTGQPEDLAITPNQIADHTILRGDLASQEDISQVEVNLTTQIDAVELEVANQSSAIRALLDAETQARLSGDDALQTSIDALEVGSQGLRSDLEAEIQARIAADDLKVDKASSVKSVAGRTGDVVLSPADIGYPTLAVLDQRTKQAQFVMDASGKTQQEINSSLAGIGDKVRLESVSAFDFFTASELSAYRTDPKSIDASRPLQAFFTFIAQNDVGTAYCNGEFYISQGLQIGIGGASKTRVVVGSPHFYATGAIDRMMVDNTGQNFEWLGFLRFTGHRTSTSGAYIYANRTCRVGFSTPDTVNSRQKFGGFHFQHFYQTGLDARYQTTLSGYGRVRANGCGSGAPTNTYCLTANWSNKVNSGSQGSTGQTSVITVDTLPSELIDTTMFAFIGNDIHVISSIDRINKTLTVYPWVDTTLESGSLVYLFGGAVDISGSDSSADYIEMIDATNCGFALYARALYSPNIGVLCSQYNGAGLGIGANRAAANRGGNVNCFYTENNRIDLLSVTLDGANSVNINSHYAFNPAKFKAIAPRSSDNSFSYLGSARGMTIRHNGHYMEYVGFPENASGSVDDIDIFNRVNYSKTFIKSSATFTLANIDKDINRMFGIDTGYVTVLNNGSGTGSPTSVTFRAPTDGSYTINGGTSDIVFTQFNGVALFMISARIKANDYVIRLVNAPEGVIRSASVTYDPPSLAPAGTAGDTATTTVTLNGVSIGDNVVASFNRYNIGVKLYPVVSAANTVTVEFKNTTGSAIDLASGTLLVKAI